MGTRLVTAVIIVALALSGLVYSAVVATAKDVVTVNDLLAAGAARENIRLGARLTAEEISYQSSPPTVAFAVRDIAEAEQPRGVYQNGDYQSGVHHISVVYNGVMPDTLRPGRDVILEGHYDGHRFVAKSLVTQCPSKYEPPLPPTGSS